MAPGSERHELNYGSKVLLPASALEKVSRLHVEWPLTLELINGEKGKHTHAGVLEFTAEEGRAYLPHWMMRTLDLDVGDMLQVKTTSLPPARLVKLQPQSVAFLDISDPKAVLEKTFRNFAALTKGDVFSFEYNGDVYDVAVLEVKPETEKMGVSMIETDVSVDFAAPKGYVEPTPDQRKPRGSGTSTPRSVAGAGTRSSSARPGGAAAPHGIVPGGLLHSHGTMAQAIGYDSLAPGHVTGQQAKSNFRGEGHSIRKTATGTSTPASTSGPVPPAAPSAPTKSTGGGANTGAPRPLRLPPNMLFFGYATAPYKSLDDKVREAEAERGRRPHFEGRGQSLRGAAAAEAAAAAGASKRKSRDHEDDDDDDDSSDDGTDEEQHAPPPKPVASTREQQRFDSSGRRRGGDRRR